MDSASARYTIGVGVIWIVLGAVAFITGSDSLGVLWSVIGAVFLLFGLFRRFV